MKNSKEKNETPDKEKANKHNLRLVWKNDNPKPDGVPCTIIGELLPHSNNTTLIIKNPKWLKEESNDKQND